MNRKRLSIGVALLVVVAGAALALFWNRPKEEEPDPAKRQTALVFPDNPLDLGVVAPHETVKGTFVARNPTDYDIAFHLKTNIKSRVICQPNEGVVPARGSLNFTVSVTLAEPTPAPQTLRVWFTTDDGGAIPYTFRVLAHCTPAIRVAPALAELGPTETGVEHAIPITFLGHHNESLNVTEAITVSTGCTYLDLAWRRESQQLVIKARPEAPLGTIEEVIQFHFEKSGTCNMHVTAIIQKPVMIAPAVALFEAAAGQPMRQPVVVWGPGYRELPKLERIDVPTGFRLNQVRAEPSNDYVLFELVWDGKTVPKDKEHVRFHFANGRSYTMRVRLF